ncbi:arsenate reductase/protein-tyrosine-phosphatase family protein [Thermoflavimicrobium dichotomicum]|uniref:Protein-tyrosine phosphatase n=1 Tax=Thermoflavimicrobium dichotomicum TaxID=46223 RepID=A0A1I3K2Z4_9BACL|nr:hypothetical protein [Thermoflavimicrobium dichotomicum]SFI66843.1 protein-tyrosine phosphatase [Thermoflavimicrobium dichotomicum]
MKRVLFVCTGNTCRSPMAEALLRKIADEENFPVEVQSAGVAAVNGSLASPQAIEVLKEKGIEHDHRSQEINEELIAWADYVLTMTSSHKQTLIQLFPQYVDKIYTLREYAEPGFEKKQKLYKQLDQLYVEMENKRAKLVAEWKFPKDETKQQELEQQLYHELEPFFKQEEQLLNQLAELSTSLDIHDPFGGSVDTYRLCCEQIEKEIRNIIQKWKTMDR